MNIAKRAALGLAAAALAAWAIPSLAQGYLASLAPLDRIRSGVTRAAEVRELLGAPARHLRFPARGVEALEYDAHDYNRKMVVSITIAGDGTVRDVQRIPLSFP
jgi:outer membrane protein assembly factor BamE (lipoprotein component of BamABCDE complex)